MGDLRALTDEELSDRLTAVMVDWRRFDCHYDDYPKWGHPIYGAIEEYKRRHTKPKVRERVRGKR